MELSELRVKLYHENCWTAELPRMFPENRILFPLSRSHTVKGTVTYTMTKGTKAEIKEVTQSDKFSKFNPRIVGEINNGKGSQIYIISFLFSHSNSVFNLSADFGEALPIRVSYKDDYEIWNFLVPNKSVREKADAIRGSIESVARIEDIKIINPPNLMKENITDYLQFYLPPSTYFLINSLSEIGYFDFPRRVSIDDAARILGISKGFISKVSRKIFELFRTSM